jgi:Tfp pilus assembly protein FimT
MAVIVILGVMAAVTGVAFMTRAPVAAADTRLARVAKARAQAVQTGQTATLQLDMNGEAFLVTAFPDGRIVTDAPIVIDPLSGRATRAAR